MNRNDVWAIAERLDMPLGLLSVDETWSAFRLKLESSALRLRRREFKPAGVRSWRARRQTS